METLYYICQVGGTFHNPFSYASVSLSSDMVNHLSVLLMGTNLLMQ